MLDTINNGGLISFDLTIDDAETVSEFYKQVIGWEKEGMSMGDYSDYFMKDAAGQMVAGVCHAKGMNASLPPQWLIYIKVDHLDESLKKCEELGGKVIGEKRAWGKDAHYCLIQDPAGAYMMLCGKTAEQQ